MFKLKSKLKISVYNLIQNPQTSAQDLMHEQGRCHDAAASHQLPIAVAFWIICMVSMVEFSSLKQNLIQIPCSTQPFWMRQTHSTHAHSRVTTAPAN